MIRSMVAFVAVFCLVANGCAQDAAIVVQRPTAPVLVRP